MEFQEVITKRRTVRDFDTKIISQDVLEKIIRDGMKAPSNSHIRNWFFINITDSQIREKIVGSEGENLLRERHIEQDIIKTGITDKESQEMYRYAIPKQASMILSAGVVLIPTFFQPIPLMAPKERKNLNYFASIWMSIENILLSAVENDIYGVTYIPNYPEKIKAILHIPNEFEIACILAMGYRMENTKVFTPDSYNVKEIIRNNEWKT